MTCRATTHGDVLVVSCGRTVRHACSTPGCRGNADLMCDAPVKKRVRGVVIDGGTCDRRYCRTCMVRMNGTAEVRDYCPAHARAAKEAT